DAVVGTYLDTTTIARLLSLSPRGTSGERDGERGCKNRAIDHWISPLPDPLPTPSSWGEGNITGSLMVAVSTCGRQRRANTMRRLSRSFYFCPCLPLNSLVTSIGYKIVRLANGVHSVHSLAHRETFHPVIGPVAEAEALYVKQLRLAERIRRQA